MKRIVVVIISLALILSACSSSSTPEAEEIEPTVVPTSAPSRTPTPTFTLVFTPTPTSTATETSTPTITLTSTNTSTPTPTLQAVTNGECIPLDTKRDIGIVKSITGGDTFIAEINGSEYKVRYIGIDSPELSDGDLGVSASNANKDLVLGKEVVLIREETDRDKDGQLPRYVVVGDTFVNEYLVSSGWANAVSYPPDLSCDKTFQESQSIAETNQSGMWSSVYFNPGSRSITPTSASLCNCSIDYDCSDFFSHLAAQNCFTSCGGSESNNWSGLDRDRNGKACESLP